MAEESQHQLLEETWDKKKIIIGVIVFLFLAGGAFAAKKYLFPTPIASQDTTHIQTTVGVKGAETNVNSPDNTPTQQSENKASFSLPSTQDIQNQVQTIQQQVTHLNVSEIASSSPQIQQIIQQIQQLPKLPGEAAKAACQQLCNNL